MIKPASVSRSDRVFESLYRRHVKDVYRYSLAILGGEADAEDATQTTFMNAYRALERGARPRDSGKWLRAIALNVCREHYRRAGRRPDEVPLEEDPGDLVLDPTTPEIGDVVRALSFLAFNQRAALVMREFEGRSLSEIGSALGVSASAAETLLFRARRSLREQLEGALTCSEAEQAISRQLDGALPRGERGPLRAHLRQCRECASLARRLRAQRTAIRSLATIPVPAVLKLTWLIGGRAAHAPITAAAASSAPTGGGSLLASATAASVAKGAVATIAAVTAVGLGVASLTRHQPRPAASRQPAGAVIRSSRPTATVAVGSYGRVPKWRGSDVSGYRTSRRNDGATTVVHLQARTRRGRGSTTAPAGGAAVPVTAPVIVASTGHRIPPGGMVRARHGDGHRTGGVHAGAGNGQAALPVLSNGRARPRKARPAPVAAQHTDPTPNQPGNVSGSRPAKGPPTPPPGAPPRRR